MIRAPFDNLRIHPPGAGFARPKLDLAGRLACDLLITGIYAVASVLVMAGVAGACGWVHVLIGG